MESAKRSLKEENLGQTTCEWPTEMWSRSEWFHGMNGFMEAKTEKQESFSLGRCINASRAQYTVRKDGAPPCSALFWWNVGGRPCLSQREGKGTLTKENFWRFGCAVQRDKMFSILHLYSTPVYLEHCWFTLSGGKGDSKRKIITLRAKRHIACISGWIMHRSIGSPKLITQPCLINQSKKMDRLNIYFVSLFTFQNGTMFFMHCPFQKC